MLVLTRKANTSIKIGNDIEITVIRISADSVRLGISAPPEVHILRDDAVKTQPKDYSL